MGSNRSILLQNEELEIIGKETRFTTTQIKRLYNRFIDLDKSSFGYLTKDDLLRIPELYTNPLRDRIVEVIFAESGTEDTINFR